MTGCEIIKCPDFKDGKCTNELDYVSKIDGSPMCPRNENAIPWEENEVEEHDPRCLCDPCRKAFLSLYGINWEPGIGVVE